MTTATPYRIDVAPRIVSEPLAMQQLRDGMANAVSEFRITELAHGIGDADDEPLAMAWETEVVDAAVAEIAPLVADMLTEAIVKRTPWTWEPER